MTATQFRLVTRSDFDGLVCAVLLKKLDLIDEIKFVHPKDMQDGKVADHATGHHHQPALCRGLPPRVRSPRARRARVGQRRQPHHRSPGAARRRASSTATTAAGALPRHPRRDDGGGRQGRLGAVHPGRNPPPRRAGCSSTTSWISRTGLGRFREFRISNYELMMKLIDSCRNHTVEQILALPDVKERVELYREHEEQFREQIKRCATVHGEARRARPAQRGDHLRGQPLHDLRAVPAVQHLHPRDVGPQEAEHRVRHRQVDHRPQLEDQRRRADAAYGGGGHEAAGTCQIDNAHAPAVMQELINQLAAPAH